jgi:hypothetical protein
LKAALETVEALNSRVAALGPVAEQSQRDNRLTDEITKKWADTVRPLQTRVEELRNAINLLPKKGEPDVVASLKRPLDEVRNALTSLSEALKGEGKESVVSRLATKLEEMKKGLVVEGGLEAKLGKIEAILGSLTQKANAAPPPPPKKPGWLGRKEP